MQILTKKPFLFKNGDEQFISKGGMVIESAPDWIVKTPLYPLVVADGNLVEIATKGRAVTAKGVTAEEAIVAATVAKAKAKKAPAVE